MNENNKENTEYIKLEYTVGCEWCIYQEDNGRCKYWGGFPDDEIEDHVTSLGVYEIIVGCHEYISSKLGRASIIAFGASQEVQRLKTRVEQLEGI
jgi:hypothetical protein